MGVPPCPIFERDKDPWAQDLSTIARTWTTTAVGSTVRLDRMITTISLRQTRCIVPIPVIPPTRRRAIAAVAATCCGRGRETRHRASGRGWAVAPRRAMVWVPIRRQRGICARRRSTSRVARSWGSNRRAVVQGRTTVLVWCSIVTVGDCPRSRRLRPTTERVAHQ